MWFLVPLLFGSSCFLLYRLNQGKLFFSWTLRKTVFPIQILTFFLLANALQYRYSSIESGLLVVGYQNWACIQLPAFQDVIRAGIESSRSYVTFKKNPSTHKSLGLPPPTASLKLACESQSQWTKCNWKKIKLNDQSVSTTAGDYRVDLNTTNKTNLIPTRRSFRSYNRALKIYLFS